jgi:hypothetical protein
LRRYQGRCGRTRSRFGWGPKVEVAFQSLVCTGLDAAAGFETGWKIEKGLDVLYRGRAGFLTAKDVNESVDGVDLAEAAGAASAGISIGSCHVPDFGVLLIRKLSFGVLSLGEHKRGELY